MQSFGDGGFLVKGETGIDFGGNSSRDDFEDFFSEFNEETVEGGIDLVVNVAAVVLSVLDCCIDEFCVSRFFCGGQ